MKLKVSFIEKLKVYSTTTTIYIGKNQQLFFYEIRKIE
jgi:hypothetical protein